MSALVSRHYLGAGAAALVDLPRQVLLPQELDYLSLLSEILTEGAGRQVTVAVPQKGDKLRLIELAEENARQVLEDRVAALTYAADRAEDALFSLQDELDLKVVPRLMVCFHISHLQGAETVGSAVGFENG